MHLERKRKHGDPTVVLKGGGPKGVTKQGRPLKGDVPGYDAVHARVRRKLGSASLLLCIDCGRQAQEWSYSGNDLDELVTQPELRREHPGLRYSLVIEMYDPRCKSCHRRMDESLIRDRDELGRFVSL